MSTLINNKRTIRITGKRQITIPQKYYEQLKFGDEAECILRNGEIILRPIISRSSSEFSEYILKDLIAQGLSGDDLLAAFIEEQSKIRPAVISLIDEADQAAQNPENYATTEDIFGEEAS